MKLVLRATSIISPDMRVTWVSHSEHNALMVDLCQVEEEWAFALMTAIVTIVKKNCITKPIND